MVGYIVVGFGFVARLGTDKGLGFVLVLYSIYHFALWALLYLWVVYIYVPVSALCFLAEFVLILLCIQL